jgi:aspartyl-tRNA(Asn)/glutamyl-tRNA(Gln) amidotransferase subunit A
VAMYLADVFVCPTNLAWLPAVSVPVGRADGLPVGGQFIAPHFGEGIMLQVAGVLERLIQDRGDMR